MEVVVYGATGHDGSEIVSELLSRRQPVKAVARNVTTIGAFEGLLTKTDDLSAVELRLKLRSGGLD